MGSIFWRFSCVVFLIGTSVCLPPTVDYRGLSRMRSISDLSALYLRDDSDDFDPSDLSFVTKIAAIGDSYSAGIGAGHSLGSFPSEDWACSRYDHAYPVLLNSDDRLGDPSKRKFQFKSCSGAVMDDVLDKQLPEIDGGQQVILISAGGNDAGLTDVLNQCIFQWASFNKEQATIGKIEELKQKLEGSEGTSGWAKSIDWDKLSLGCDGQLLATQAVIDSKAFSDTLDTVIEAAKSKLSSDGTMYYTGYAKFWAEDLSSDCDKVTWTTWIHKTYNIWLDAARLTSDSRKRMNDLVDAVNKKLEEAISRAGNQVVFVNYDSWVGKFGGRMCEKGVDGSTLASNHRSELMFYELDINDWWGTNPYKRSTETHANGTFGGDINAWALLVSNADPDAELSQEQYLEDASTTNAAADVTLAGGLPGPCDFIDCNSIFQIENMLPDGFGRVFHPQINLHGLIANMIIYEMINVNLLKNNGNPIPESSKPTATVCSHSSGATAVSCKSDNDCSSPNCAGGGLVNTCENGQCSCHGRTTPTITAPPTATTSWATTDDVCKQSMISLYAAGGGLVNWCSVYTSDAYAVQPCTTAAAIADLTGCFKSQQTMYTVPYATRMEPACTKDSHQYTSAWQYMSSACYAANVYFASRA